MLSRAKQSAHRMVARWPVYRAMPPGPLRTYAAIKYLGEHASQAALVNYLRSAGIPSRPLPTALVAARAMFRAGQDDLLESALARLSERYPRADAVAVLQTDLVTFHGEYPVALRQAERAMALRAAPAPAARVVKLSYRVHPREQADEVAVAAVQQFPTSVEVMWQVAMHCQSVAQYERVQRAWQERSGADPADLLVVVRQLAVAASRAGEVDAAAGWYRRALALLAESKRPAPPMRVTSLAGLGARRAIEDLVRVFDEAGVPFFFAAGTALGLVREGRPLGADGDIDVGVLDADWDRDTLVKIFQHDPAFDLDLHPQTQKVGLRHRGGSPVDIFRFYPDGDRVWHDGVFVRWWNTRFEVERREIGEVAVPLPADPERYLTENYGPQWRTPWPGFDAFTDDAPNLEVTWPDYQRMHFLRRAYQRLAASDRPGAAQELRRGDEDTLAETVSAR